MKLFMGWELRAVPTVQQCAVACAAAVLVWSVVSAQIVVATTKQISEEQRKNNSKYSFAKHAVSTAAVKWHLRNSSGRSSKERGSICSNHVAAGWWCGLVTCLCGLP